MKNDEVLCYNVVMMKKRITEEECKKLYEKYGTPTHVIGHCRAVSDTALAIGRCLNAHGYNLDLALIKGAGLAHDIARTRENHGEVCAEILNDLGYADEADIVSVHMHYDFHDFSALDEKDIVCLGDRLVKEDRYVGLDERIEYILHKVPEDEERRRRILQKKKETRALMDKIEAAMGQTIDSLFQADKEKL